MAGNEGLFQAMNMFKQGVQDLAVSYGVSKANDEVQQIKASQMDEMQKRSALQDVANRTVSNMAAAGANANILDALKTATMPKQFANANAMNIEAMATGDTSLGELAKKQQDFESNKAFELAKIKATARMAAANDPLHQARLNEAIGKEDALLLGKYKDDIDASKASSRTQFGQWAQVQGRGERIYGLLGDPTKWKTMNSRDMALVADSAVQMSKGGVATKDESELLAAHGAKFKLAAAKEDVLGVPSEVDMTGYAKLFHSIAEREDAVAKEKLLDTVYSKVQSNAHVGLRPTATDQFRRTTAAMLGQQGIAVNPDTIQVDKKKGVVIPELTPIMDAANNAPKAVNDAMAAYKKNDPEATKFMQSYGITPDMPTSMAIRLVRAKIKKGAFGE